MKSTALARPFVVAICLFAGGGGSSGTKAPHGEVADFDRVARPNTVDPNFLDVVVNAAARRADDAHGIVG